MPKEPLGVCTETDSPACRWCNAHMGREGKSKRSQRVGAAAGSGGRHTALASALQHALMGSVAELVGRGGGGGARGPEETRRPARRAKVAHWRSCDALKAGRRLQSRRSRGRTR